MSDNVVPFPAGFLWGVSTAAYQIEGAAAEDGRGPSIWDVFSEQPGAVAHGDNGVVATDHYHRLEEDLNLLEALGSKVYRFSFSWSRVLPTGRGPVNPSGMAFYNRLVDGLLARGIEPIATLYHWDLPQALQKDGGWADRSIVSAFAEYATIMATEFGDRIEKWTTINEPWVMTYLGNAFGAHAPGISDLKTTAFVHHHVLLAHAAGAAAIRSAIAEPIIGIALNMSHIYPAVSTPASESAAAIAFDQLVNSFLEPLQFGAYPDTLTLFSDWWAVGGGIVQEGDLTQIAGSLDFLSINEYHPRYVVAEEDLDRARLAGYAGEGGTPFTVEQPFVDVDPPRATRTLMGWIIEPQGLTDLLVTIGSRFPSLPLYISENGAAYADYADQDGAVKDPERVAYLDGHLRAAAAAIAQGVDLRGYFLWSFLDNFEWAEGYSKRFGIVYVDYPTGTRIPKSSFQWYRDVIAENAIPEGSRSK